jgi:uncharacterized protein YpmB
MKQKLLLAAILLLFRFTSGAQQTFDLKENETILNNDLDYGYSITNEKNKEVKGENYDRFEMEIFITNKSGCLKLIPLRANNLGQADSDESYKLALFNIKNATGKRLTAKSGTLEAKPWYTLVKLNGATVLTQALVGYGVKPGQQINKKIIVIVPKGERPVVTVKTNYLPQVL